MKLLINRKYTSNIIFDNANDFLKRIIKSNNIFIICDINLRKYYKWLNGYKKIFFYESTEENKNFESLVEIFNILFNEKIDRSYFIVAIGGGSFTDKIGFVASTWMRGINLIYIPTTLLAMADAAIGGKTGVNFNNIKNLIGTYYFPRYIVIDTNFVNTLPNSMIIDGMAEIIKHGLLKEKSIIKYLFRINKVNYKTLIKKSIKVKIDIIKKDPYENKNRYLLNFGHTIGHAIETTHNLHHGLAIFNGMYYEMLVSEKLIGYPKFQVINILLKLGEKFNLKIIKFDKDNTLIDKLYFDKKGVEDHIYVPIIKETGNSEVIKINKDKYIKTVKTIINQNGN
ncbi:MAG: 3-dehydroquinate synthase [Bacteroidales bacterium]|nr:3-dehydroquinate synthase [Bacteroidales bacterium]